jgi:hypothetical protein
VTTQEVVQRVRPLLELLSSRSVDKARLLQYLSARAGVDWGALTFIGEEGEEGARLLVFQDRVNQEYRRVRYPDCLPPDLEAEILADYKRRALGRKLSTMAPRLFAHFFRDEFCGRCRFDHLDRLDADAAVTDQVCHECRFAGRPINFEPRSSAP